MSFINTLKNLHLQDDFHGMVTGRGSASGDILQHACKKHQGRVLKLE
jgi:hypothetical protein